MRKRKRLTRERQCQHRQRIKVNAEAIEQVKEEDCTQYGNEWLSNQVHVEEQNCEQFQRCCANIRSQERKRLARERQHRQRQKIRVNAEAIEWLREEDHAQHAKERLSNQAHVQEQNQQQLQRYHANMTEEQQQEQQAHDCTRQQEQQAHDHTRHAIQRLSNQAHVQEQNQNNSRDTMPT